MHYKKGRLRDLPGHPRWRPVTGKETKNCYDICYKISSCIFFNLVYLFDRDLCKDDGSGDSVLHHLGYHLLHDGSQGLVDRHTDGTK